MSQGNYWLGLSDAFGRVAAGIGRFVRYEIDLAANEAREDLSRLFKSAGLLVAGGVVAVVAIATLVATLIAVLTAVLVALGLAEAIASSLACFVTTLAFGGIAWMLFARARAGMRDLKARLERIMTVFADAAAQPRPPDSSADQGHHPLS